MDSVQQKHFRVCNLCEAMCGLEIIHDGRKVLSVKGDKKDPLSKGSICPKGALIHELHNDPNKLRTPLRKKENGEWEVISWKLALDIVGAQINKIRKNHGADAIGLYFGNPTVHNFGMMMMAGEMKRILRTKNVFSPTSMDQLPHHFIGYYMYGHSLNISIPDIDRTQYLVIFGANPVASNGSLMSAPGIQKRLKDIQARGGRIIQFDPRKNETSRIVDEHYFIRPNTDVYLLLAMLHLIQKNSWIKIGNLQNHIRGLGRLRGIAQEFTPQRVAEMTGVSQETILRITQEYAQSQKAVLYGRMGMSTQEYGGLSHWLCHVINILTGHFDTPGGAMFATPAFDVRQETKFRTAHKRWFSRVRQLPEFAGELPVSVMAEEMSTPGEGQIKALITYAGNPVLSTPNGKQLDRMLPKLDFMVSIDIFLNETSRHADIILPPPSHLEIEHYDLIFNMLSVSNNVKFSSPLFHPPKGQLYDWQIARELIKRFAKASPKKPSKLFQWLTPKQLLSLGLLMGPYGKLSHPKRWFSGLSLKKIIHSTHGISLGALKPGIPEILLTKDKKINLADEVFLNGLNQLKATLIKKNSQKLSKNQFLLIGRRHLRSNNSWMHNVDGLMKGKNRCTALIHPQDAHKLQLHDHQKISVVSQTGSIDIPIEITDEIMPGVLSIPHGYGHSRNGVQLTVASRPENAGVSVNDITDHNLMDAVTGNAVFSGQIVSVIT